MYVAKRIGSIESDSPPQSVKLLTGLMAVYTTARVPVNRSGVLFRRRDAETQRKLKTKDFGLKSLKVFLCGLSVGARSHERMAAETDIARRREPA
jgi:hypothetical protein